MFTDDMLDVTGGDQKAQVIADLSWLEAEANKRCLYETALWAQECLVFQSPELLQQNFKTEEIPPPQYSAEVEVRTRFVRSLIQNKEFHRAIFHAQKFPQPFSSDHAFLFFFASYLVSLSRYSEKDPKHQTFGVRIDDDSMPMLARKYLMLKISSPSTFDCWNYYMLGMVCKAAGDNKKARDAFVDAIKIEPRCWPAWENLALMVQEKSEICVYPIPQRCWQFKMYAAKAYARLNITRNAMDVYDDLVRNTIGPVPYIITENAIAASTLQEHSTVISNCEVLRDMDPLRIDGMEIYADTLYVRYGVSELFLLSRFFYKSHQFNWRFMAILANYYSVTKQHEQAYKTLIRALQLSPKNSNLWILLGHECLELKNPTDAVTAYRKAICLEPKNYRAYYCMGQLFEIFRFTEYALHYYELAHRNRPADSRMLVAMGVAFFHLKRYKEAEISFIKAFKIGDIQGNALTYLGNLYEELKEHDKAVSTYKTFMKIYGEETHADSGLIAGVSLYLARHHTNKKQYEEAMNYAEKCLEEDKTKNDALNLIREIKLKQSGADTNISTPPPSAVPIAFTPVQNVTSRLTTPRRQHDEEVNLMNTSDDDEDISF